MGYTTIDIIRSLMANALTSATQDTTDQLGDLLNVGNTLDVNLITPDVINVYSQDADRRIDGILNSLYATPLKRVCDLELKLITNLSLAGTDNDSNGSDNDTGGPNNTSKVVVLSSEAVTLIPGDTLNFVDGGYSEEFTITAINDTQVTLNAVPLGYYSPTTARVLRIDYPATIRYIATRLAAANIFDKYFAAQADKNESQFGKFFRKMADHQLNNILTGVTTLHGQRRTGHLTMSPTLRKRYGTPKGWNDGPFKLDDATQ